jgi:hypothetical protein
VTEGTYKENINFKGKNIILASKYLLNKDTSIISKTIIDGNFNGHVVTFKSGETSNTQLIGFKIINGKTPMNQVGGDYNSTCGGGIYCVSSSPTLKNLIIENNETTGNNHADGAGIFIIYSSPYISNSIIRNNISSQSGGGVSIDYGSNPTIVNCIFENNNSLLGGGAISVMDDYNSNSTFTNLKIINNKSGDGGAIKGHGDFTMKNSIIANNSANRGGGLYLLSFIKVNLENVDILYNKSTGVGAGIYVVANPELSLKNCIINNNLGSAAIYNDANVPANLLSIDYCNFYNNIDGNFANCSSYYEKIVTTNVNGTSCDAYFNIYCDPKLDTFSYKLIKESPCIDAGSNNNVYTSTDINGNERIWDGNNDSVPTIDIGANEYGSIPVISIDKQNVSIHGGNDGYIKLSISSESNRSLQFIWNTGDTLPGIYHIKAGTYEVLIVDNALDTIKKKIEITEPKCNVHCNFITTKISIHGGNDGAIKVSPYGGLTPYKFIWNTNDSVDYIDSLRYGTYSLVISDSVNCVFKDTITFEQPVCDLKLMIDSIRQVTSYDKNDGYIAITTYEGIPPYKYKWNTSDSINYLDSLNKGTYNVTVLDSVGCSLTKEFIIDVLTNINTNSMKNINFSLYPNPANNEISVELFDETKSKVFIKIYNSNGIVFYEKEIFSINKSLIIPIINYPNGIYLCKIQYEAIEYIFKFEKQK